MPFYPKKKKKKKKTGKKTTNIKVSSAVVVINALLVKDIVQAVLQWILVRMSPLFIWKLVHTIRSCD